MSPKEFENHFLSHNFPPNYDPSYNKDGWHLAHWFGDKRHFRPWYDDDADYNTNAKSYYDYLGFRIRQLDYMIDAINSLMRRDVQVSDTNSIDMSKIGEWLKGDDIENLSADLKISAENLNALKVLGDGAYVKDLEPEIQDLREQLRDLRDDLERLRDEVKQNTANINNLSKAIRDGLDGLNGKINNLEREIKSILNRLNGKYETIPSANWYHKFYNGSSDVPAGWGTFKAGAIYGQNSVTLNVRLPYANHNLQNLELNGGALPLSNHPMSYVLGFGFTGDYSFINDMKIESVQITNGAPHIEPVSARASWTIGYNFDHDKKILGADPYQLTLATFADGYNDKNTFKTHYSNISLKGDILTATFNLSGKVPEKFWNGTGGETPPDPAQPDKTITATENHPEGVSDLGRDVTRTINLISE